MLRVQQRSMTERVIKTIIRVVVVILLGMLAFEPSWSAALVIVGTVCLVETTVN